MPVGSRNGTRVATLTQDSHKRRVLTQFLLTPFGASFKPVLVCAAVTGMWFFLFWGPYKADFADLFPVSQWLWLPLLLIITGLAPTLFHHQFITRQKREKCFIQFCILARQKLGQEVGREISVQYVLNHRSPNKLETGKKSIDALLYNQPALSRIWYLSLSVEQQARPYGLTIFAYACVWIFCLSVPFVYWSFYQEYGLLGLPCVSWPILAIIYGPLNNTNQFDDPGHTRFVISDYNERVNAYFAQPETPQNQYFTAKSD